MKMARLSFIALIVFTMVCMMMRATSAHTSVVLTIGHLLGSALAAAFFIRSMDDEARAELSALGFALLTIAYAGYVGRPLPLFLALTTIMPIFVCMAWGALTASSIINGDIEKRQQSGPSLDTMRRQHDHDRAMEAIRRTQR